MRLNGRSKKLFPARWSGTKKAEHTFGKLIKMKHEATR